MNDTGSILTLPRDVTSHKHRIINAIAVNRARTVAFIAHHARLSYNDTQHTLGEMLAEGWFKVVDDDGVLRFGLTGSGEPIVEPDLYCAIITAVAGGARTAERIAYQIGLPDSTALRYAIILSLRLRERS